ncbi:HTH-type transcriptional regulator CynR [Pigmentiphaga humi]|uniref:HTH-type transcriptional regulator CynR n=1 Tax=Pigmentiphaga humi TaxID=2478468 RepID=A0A3P4B5K2_9BURK|nr:LysR family transcriptional regulator [Pigmentiphaga humi]VCU70920.1 HTH-type transcriptional regulator CynR [Pigmentiphaga humi]
MNSDDLALFTRVADTGSFSAAALADGLDTSNVSRRIAQLEKDLGVRLFRRNGRGVALTGQGEVLLTYAREVGSSLEAARTAVSSTARRGPARIRIAAQPTIARALFGDLFHALRAHFPHSQVHFTEGLADTILADLQSGALDLAVLYRPEHVGGMVYEPLLLERLYLLAPPGFPVTQAHLCEHGLKGLPLILPSTRHGLRVFVEALASRHGYAPTIALESDGSNALTVDLVHKGCGCSVLPLATVADDIACGRLQGFPIPGEDVERAISLVLGRSDMEARDLWPLTRLIRSVTARLAEQGAWPGARPVPQPADGQAAQAFSPWPAAPAA